MYMAGLYFLFDVTQAKFIIFGKVFWPQDFFIFGLAMITFIVFIVLFTAAVWPFVLWLDLSANHIHGNVLSQN